MMCLRRGCLYGLSSTRKLTQVQVLCVHACCLCVRVCIRLGKTKIDLCVSKVLLPLSSSLWC